ncbi:MAG: iron-containing alcohol dehydrogenase [Anaerolineae bacterium]
MDKILHFQMSGRLIFGNGAVGELPAVMDRLDAARVLIVTDPGLVEAGVCGRIQGILEDADVAYETFDGVEADPSIRVVRDGLAMAQDVAPDALIGLGGGSSMDIAKVISILMTNDGDATDYIGSDRVPGPGLPKVTVPTTSGTGSEVSPIAVLSDEEEHLKKGVVSEYLYADVALVDPTLTLTLPPAVSAYTGIDALTHAIEAYTNRYAHPLIDTLALRAIRLIGGNLRRAVACGEDRQARYNMSMASLLGGMCLGSVNTGAVHALAYPLGGEYDVPHGVANSLLLPYVMRYNLISDLERFAEIAAALGENLDGLSLRDAADRAVDAVMQLCQDVGIVTQLRELDIPEDAIDEMAAAAMKVTRLLSINPRHVTEEAARQIYRDAY